MFENQLENFPLINHNDNNSNSNINLDETEQFVKATQIQRRYSVSSATLRRWEKNGKLRTVKSPGGHRLYSNADIQALFGRGLDEKAKARICYARVSSEHMLPELQSQIEEFKEKFPDHEILSDIGSGLNYQRPHFRALLERVIDGEVEEIVIGHKDRLCRYGYELLEFIFEKTGTRVVILGQNVEGEEATRELADDLLVVTTYFVAKHNGMRAGETKRRRRKEKEAEEQVKKSRTLEEPSTLLCKSELDDRFE